MAQNCVLPDDLAIAEGRLLTRGQAAGYLGSSLSMVTKLVKQGRLSVVYLGHRVPRFLLSDLDEFILSVRAPRHAPVLTEESKEIPRAIAAKLLNVTISGMESARWRGDLKDLTPVAIRACIIRQAKSKLMEHARAKYYNVMENQRQALIRLRKQLTDLTCTKCYKASAYRKSQGKHGHPMIGNIEEDLPRAQRDKKK